MVNIPYFARKSRFRTHGCLSLRNHKNKPDAEETLMENNDQKRNDSFLLVYNKKATDNRQSTFPESTNIKPHSEEYTHNLRGGYAVISSFFCNKLGNVKCKTIVTFVAVHS